MRIELKRLDDAFHFEAVSETGNIVMMDAGENIGGHNKGVRPMQMMIMGLGGCSAIDVVLILKKQKQVIEDFQISIDAEREKDKEPALWETVQIHFKLKGKIEKEKAERAVQLSMDKYCSVSKTLEIAGAKITYKVSVNE
ncbi:MAG: osmotically inducible protein OsmC [Bacteroidetes bacterium]|jgi:putative redox protein|nr:osmotically inducible protein OsmC [Bacteroidota bacterium]